MFLLTTVCQVNVTFMLTFRQLELLPGLKLKPDETLNFRFVRAAIGHRRLYEVSATTTETPIIFLPII